MSALWTKIEEATAFIRNKTDFQPELGLILGTGLGELGDRIDTVCTIPYTEVPHFVASTAISHAGNLVLGNLGGRRVLAMQGRLELDTVDPRVRPRVDQFIKFLEIGIREYCSF